MVTPNGPTTGGMSAMLEWARTTIGMGEPNLIQAWYRARNGSDFAGNFSWCQASICYWAFHSGNYDSVMFGVDDAYTVTAAQRAQSHGLWVTGTTANVEKMQPGDILYYDWGESNDISAIDHVGICEKQLGSGNVQTIEGNTSDVCARRVRSTIDIAGYYRPAYTTTPAPLPPVVEDDMFILP